ncbi:MAG: DUF1385 domain-containing protein [Bryobacteraceae bacterium]
MHFRDVVRLFAHIQVLPVLENGEETTLIGGQAVMEGVMMRSPHSYCVAVRRPDGEISVQEEPLPRLTDRHPILKWPMVRGLATLGGAMWLGMKALKFSADCTLGKSPEEKKEEKASGPAGMVLQVCFSLLFMIGLYKLVPLYLATQLGKHFEPLSGRLAINFTDGLLRIGIFLSFMFLLSQMKDMRRLFQYHGAEHRVVFNFESGKDVTIENAQQFVTWHPRCGTSFLFVVLIVAMVLYAFLPIDNFAMKFLARIALFPVIVGVSYEIIRFAAKQRNGFLAILTRPGLWLQRVTTKSPSDDQTEVAIYALNHAMALEKAQGGQLVIA